MQDLQFDVVFTVNFSLLKGLGRLRVSSPQATVQENVDVLLAPWIQIIIS